MSGDMRQAMRRQIGRGLGFGLGLLPLLAGLPLMTGCSPRSDTASLFPLEPGHRWVYSVSTTMERGAGSTELRVISTRGAVDLPQGGSAWVRRSEDGVEWLLKADETGVYRVASRTDLQDEPQPDPAPRYVLKAPVAVGTSWQAPTAPYLLRRNAEFPPEIRHAHPSVPMNYQIEALDASVETPAGAFRDCVRVVGQATLRLFADPVNGWRDLPLTTTEWYCRGPGLVKMVREEPANSTFLAGGRMVLELQEWR